jgi:Ni,Fe-hydrogenase III component G
MTLETLLATLGGAWDRPADGCWRTLDLDRLRPAAQDLKRARARFAALTVRPDGPALRLAWHWDLGGTLLTLVAAADPAEPVPSLVDLWPGADWAEREARDYYAVRFSGRASTPTLMLREGEEPGVLLRKDGR